MGRGEVSGRTSTAIINNNKKKKKELGLCLNLAMLAKVEN